ncbi:MAG: diguanylate cyclase [Hylemonella sp.]|nr:diguanylate cyclase [Hylemonella sp.]
MARNIHTLIATAQQKRWMDKLLLWLLVLLVIGTLVGAAIRVRQNLAAEYLKVVLESERIALDLNRELELQAYSVAALGAMGDSVLHGSLRLMENPVRRLVPVPGKGGYTAVIPPEFGPPERHGNITGLGRIPGADTLAAREMTMAVSLTPVMRAIKSRTPDIPWVYYTSASGFMFLYPRVPVDAFFHSRELEQTPYYQGALPQANPARSIFWTPLYEDAAGQGQMVTVGRPVYQGERFLGVLSIDIGVRTLLRHVTQHAVPHSTLYLYDAKGKAMLNPDGQAPAIDPALQTAGEPVPFDGQRVTAFRLPTAGWHLVVQTDHRAMVLNALLKTSFHIATVLLFLVSLVLIALLTRSVRQVRSLSVHDALTGLYNRRHFEEVARTEWARSRRHELWLGLMLVDVDFFKKYNDHYGHPMGDSALQDVASAMRQSLRRATDGLFRVGGEEFAVLVELRYPSDLGPLADKLNEAVRSLGRAHAPSPHGVLTVSIGTTLIGPGQWVDVEAAYKCADEALYQAKESGRDKNIYRSPL